MAAVTSLPELMVGISSVVFLQSADLALGDILGSCAINLGILSLMDVFTPRDSPLFSRVSKSQILAAAFGVLLIALVGMSIYLDVDLVISPFIGFTSISFLLVYIVAIRTIFNFQNNKAENSVSESHSVPPNMTLKKVVLRYVLFAVIIIASALALPHFAEGIAEATGLGKSFVGTFFLAASTSLPEIAVSYSFRVNKNAFSCRGILWQFLCCI